MEPLKINELVWQRNELETKLSSLLYGSIEKRTKDNRVYAYLHRREDGISVTKYLGEYTDKIEETVVRDTIKAKDIKKKLKDIKKNLALLNYVDEDLSEKIANNIDFVRRHLADTIYRQAVLEGIATTLSDTETILEGGKINNMTPTDVQKIVNLKHAWEFLLNKYVITTRLDFNVICEINRLVEEGFYYNAGKVRVVPVNISGTSYKPDLPIESVVREEILEILDDKSIETIEDKAIRLLLYLTKRQIFIDGNKRSALIAANHLFISNGLGVIAIPSDRTDEYKRLLISFYEDKVEASIVKFIKDYCLIKL
ncbi:MAG: Fic family protein [Candidatus Cloacimonetes bacterium]|nr:Fic family protein [Candidatus Cloacimonadota bacterium]